MEGDTAVSLTATLGAEVLPDPAAGLGVGSRVFPLPGSIGRVFMGLFVTGSDSSSAPGRVAGADPVTESRVAGLEGSVLPCLTQTKESVSFSEATVSPAPCRSRRQK